jgi:hypothetical protein
MYYTHHFAHQETLRRACEWLGEFGYRPWEIERQFGGVPSLGLEVEPGRMGAVELLVNALETSDPDGWPGFWDESRLPHPWASSPGREPRLDGVETRPSPVGWHPLDESRRENPELDLLRDVMGH